MTDAAECSVALGLLLLVIVKTIMHVRGVSHTPLADFSQHISGEVSPVFLEADKHKCYVARDRQTFSDLNQVVTLQC